MNHVDPAEHVPSDAREWVDISARRLGLRLDAEALGRVALHWQRLQSVLELLEACPLGAHQQPAPEFVPGAEPAP